MDSVRACDERVGFRGASSRSLATYDGIHTGRDLRWEVSHPNPAGYSLLSEIDVVISNVRCLIVLKRERRRIPVSTILVDDLDVVHRAAFD